MPMAKAEGWESTPKTARKRGKGRAKSSPTPGPDTSAVSKRTRVKPEFILARGAKVFVKYEGLLALAHDIGLSGIQTEVIDVTEERALIHAIVTMEKGQTFSGIGEAWSTEKGQGRDGIDMGTTYVRMAETRAKARALRDATNVGITAWEEVDTELEGEE